MRSNFIYIILALIFSTINVINGFTSSHWGKLINAPKLYQQNYLNTNTEYINNLVKSTNVSQECAESISETMRSLDKSLDNLEDWAYQMFNSWGDFPPKGVLEGTVTDFGDYDQCLSITPNQVIGESQYCLVDISLPLPKQSKYQNFFHEVKVLPESVNKTGNNVFLKLSKDASFFYWLFLRVGICTPNKCNKTDIQVLAEKSLINLGLILKDVNCETKFNVKLNFIQIFAILFLSTFIFGTIFASTFIRFCEPKRNSNIFRTLNAFSLRKNLKKLLSTQTDQQLCCIHGLRVLTIVWVIVAHTIAWSGWQIFRKTFEMKQLLSAPENQLIIQSYYSVETFFFISGLLTTYITLKYSEGKYENFNKMGFLISRLIRLTPQLAIFILLTTLIPLFGSGPVWNQQISPHINNCYNNWWQNLLYVQNLIDVKNSCATHTWYLSSDMQFHWISFIVLIVLHNNIKFGLIVNYFVIIAFTLLTSIIIFIYDFPPGEIPTAISEFFVTVWPEILYQKPWPHGSVYFIGLAFGYFVHKIGPKKLSKSNKLLIWTLLLMGYMTTIFNTHFWMYGEPYNRWISAALYPMNRIIWAINTATLIWMCITGNGGFINEFLSWKVFIPLSRLTYSVYLTHIWIVWIYWGSKRDLFDLNNFSFLLLFSSIIFLSYILGAIFSLLFESPIFALQKHLKDHNNSNIQNTELDNEELKNLNYD